MRVFQSRGTSLGTVILVMTLVGAGVAVGCSNDPVGPDKGALDSGASDASSLPSGDGYGPRVTPGIQPGVTLREAPANWSTSANGQLVEGLIFRTQPRIRHARVHFRNCRWLTADGPNHWAYHPAVFDTPATAGAVFEHVDFEDALPVLGSGDPAQPMRVIASIFRGTSDGYGDSAKIGSNVVIEDSIFRYDYPQLPEAHADGLQSDVGSVANVTVRYSYFDVTGPGANGALLQNEGGEEVGNWLIENNHIHSSGAFAIRVYHLTGSGRVMIRNNRIDRIWIYGPLDLTDHPELIDWVNNVDETGSVISP